MITPKFSKFLFLLTVTDSEHQAKKTIVARHRVTTATVSNFCAVTFKSFLTKDYTGLFKTIVGVLTTCHAQYTWDRSICVF